MTGFVYVLGCDAAGGYRTYVGWTLDLEMQVAGDGKDDGGHETAAAAGSIRAVRSSARRRSVASNYMR